MKTIKKIVMGGALVLALTTNAFAIEGIHVSIDSSNVVLAWPGDSSKNYIVQYIPALTSTNGWQTLTSLWPGDPVADLTTFVHTNGADFGYATTNSNGSGTNSGGGMLPPGGGGGSGGGNGMVYMPGIGFYRVVQDGVRISNASMYALTNGMLSDSVAIAFEAGNASGDGTGTNVLGDINSATIMVDGAKFAGDGVLSSPTNSSPWQFSMDTAYLENGDHTLQVNVEWLNPDNTDGNHVNFTRQSDPVTITVSNAIYYPQWEPEVGEMGVSAYFFKTAFTNIPWKIDIFDVSNKLAQTLTNVSSDGIIEAYWNMVDTNGVTRTNADLDPEFSAVITVYDAPISKPAPPKIQRKRNWPDHGIWTVAYQDFFKFEYSANNLMQSSINYFAVTTGQYGGYYLYYPPSGSTNDIGQTYPMRYQKTAHPDPSLNGTTDHLDRQLLLNFLASTNSRNFFFDGHGGPNTFAQTSSFLLETRIHHRYRFVMLDACSTANGDLDKAFGIKGPGLFDITHYENTGVRPAAFCGYDTDVTYATGGTRTVNGVDYDDTIPDDVPYFISNFLFYWRDDLNHQGLRQSIDNAGNNLPNPGGPGQREYHWVITGYDALKIDDFNHVGDTW